MVAQGRGQDLLQVSAAAEGQEEGAGACRPSACWARGGLSLCHPVVPSTSGQSEWIPGAPHPKGPKTLAVTRAGPQRTCFPTPKHPRCRCRG